MSEWTNIEGISNLPREDDPCDLLFSSGVIFRGRLTINEYSETVWLLKDGRVAHIDNYTEAERKEFGIVTVQNMESPIAWRPSIAA